MGCHFRFLFLIKYQDNKIIGPNNKTIAATIAAKYKATPTIVKIKTHLIAQKTNDISFPPLPEE